MSWSEEAAEIAVTLMFLLKSREPQTGHSGILPGYVIMKGTISIHWKKRHIKLI